MPFPTDESLFQETSTSKQSLLKQAMTNNKATIMTLMILDDHLSSLDELIATSLQKFDNL